MYIYDEDGFPDVVWSDVMWIDSTVFNVTRAGLSHQRGAGQRMGPSPAPKTSSLTNYLLFFYFNFNHDSEHNPHIPKCFGAAVKPDVEKQRVMHSLLGQKLKLSQSPV